MVSFHDVHSMGSDPWGSNLYNGKIVMLHQLVAEGGWPFWDPSEACGRPVWADPAYKVMNPFQWISAVYPSLAVMNFIYAGKFFLTFLFMLLLLRRFSLAWTASIAGALAWVTNGYVLGYYNHNHFDVIVFFPLAILGVRHLSLGDRLPAFLMLTASFYMFLVGGNPQSGIIGFALTFIFYLFTCGGRLFKRKAGWLTDAGIPSAALVIALFMGAAALGPMFEFSGHWVDAHSPDLWKQDSHGLYLLYKFMFPKIADAYQYTGEWPPYFSFVGTVLILLFLTKIVRIREAMPFLLVLLFSFYLLSENTLLASIPVKTLLSKIPFVNIIRYPKYTEGIFFSGAILLAFSIDLLLAGRMKRFSRGALIWGALVAGIVCLFFLNTGRNFLGFPLLDDGDIRFTSRTPVVSMPPR